LEKILKFKDDYGVEFKKISKREEYLRRFRPEIYEEVFGAR